jgi:hypothetical protein
MFCLPMFVLFLLSVHFHPLPSILCLDIKYQPNICLGCGGGGWDAANFSFLKGHSHEIVNLSSFLFP